MFGKHAELLGRNIGSFARDVLKSPLEEVIRLDVVSLYLLLEAEVL